MTESQKIVAIFGTSKAKPSDEVFQTACTLGKLLAQNGFTIANGGYGGTMLAASKGASDAGGKVIGVTCSAFKRSSPNKYITSHIQTKSLPERLNKLIELADAYFVLPGGTGTLLELAEIWELKNKGFDYAQKPIIIIGRFWEKLIDLMALADADCVKCLKIAHNPTQAVKILLNSW